jgi:hypothetical protein
MRPWFWYLLGILTVLVIGVGRLFLSQGIWQLIGIWTAIAVGAGGTLLIQWLRQKSKSTITARPRAWYLSGILTAVAITASGIYFLSKEEFYDYRPKYPPPDPVIGSSPLPSPPTASEESLPFGFPEFPWPPHRFTTHLLAKPPASNRQGGRSTVVTR